jgi:hypothetical protein
MWRRNMICGRTWRTLHLTMVKQSKDRSAKERSLRSPPLWIHITQAGRWLFSPREAKKQAVIRLLDALNTGVRPPGKTGV